VDYKFYKAYLRIMHSNIYDRVSQVWDLFDTI